MALLEKLHIRGIRSFGLDDDEKITFLTPLTLFLGENGCGKTTIIECLKFALIGELPGGSERGKGFVNNPELSGKKSTTGAIKLVFRDGKGEFVTVEREVNVSLANLTTNKGPLKKGTVTLQDADQNVTLQLNDSGKNCQNNIVSACNVIVNKNTITFTFLKITKMLRS